MVHVECNIGESEKAARTSVGAALLGMALTAPIGKPARIVAGAVGGYGLITGLLQFCPINQAVHRNTCPTAHHPHD